MILQELFARHQRAIALSLAAYGATGLFALLAFAAALGPVLAAADTFARSSSEASVALAASVDAFDGFATSLTEARAAAERAAGTASGSAAVARDLAGRMSISIFGVQPLLSLAQSFRRQGEELEALSSELSELAVALERNQADVATLRSSVAVIRDRFGALGARAGSAAGADVGVPVYALLAWLAFLPTVSLAAGVALWRDAASRPSLIESGSRAA